jgi:plasmid replication initiation protein
MGLRQPPTGDGQLQLFSAIFTDIATRDARETMEVPFLSLSKNPRFEPIRFERDDVKVTVTGGKPYGIATIWDWDLVLWLLSQIRHALDRGQQPSRKVRFHRQAFLNDARRASGGTQYKRLEESIARLHNTNVVTTIRAKGGTTVMFHWIEYSELERDAKGRVTNAVVVLPEWLFDAVCDKTRILSLHRDYFLLTGGLERWLYRFIRKGAGHSASGWRWKLETLRERSATTQELKYFARELRTLAARGPLLEYDLRLEREDGEVYLRASRRDASEDARPAPVVPDPGVRFLGLRPATYERAKAIAPGYDIYALEADWRAATARNGVELKSADAAFLAWCRRVDERSPIR